MSSQNPQVIFETFNNNKSIITLNRPEKLNALNFNMIQPLSENLMKSSSRNYLLTIIKANGRAFSTGVDLIALQDFKDGEHQFKEYAHIIFHITYTLIWQILTYKPHLITFIDGITMSIGAGIAIHSKYRVITERTIFTMPGTSIGFFPDVGASYFLNKLEGKLGLYLALTGESLKGEEIVIYGIGTHFVPSDLLPDLERKLLDCENDYEIEVTLDCFHRYTFDLGLGNEKKQEIKEIDACFDAESVEEILMKLKQNGSRFCLKTREILLKKSPTSLKVTFEAWKRAKSMNLIDCLSMEYRIATNFLNIKHKRYFGHAVKEHSDFNEGVRAFLIDKNRIPRWFPCKLEEVDQELVEGYFN